MKGCMKDFSKLRDSNRERVAFSSANRAEARLLNQTSLNQIVDYMESESTRGAIQPGLKILGFSARPNGLENLKKSHVIETEFQPGLDMRSDFVFHETRWLPLQRRSDFSGIKEKIENLIRCLANFKAQMEYKNIDFNADKVERTRRAWIFLLFLCKYVFLAERYVAKDRFRFSSIIL